MKVLIADDHNVVREGLKHIIETKYRPVTFGDAHDGTEALNLVFARDWDLLLLDIQMPGRDGLEVLREAKKTRPKLPVLIVSGSSQDEYAVRALRDGASGYLEKNASEQEFLLAVEEALAGRCYVTPAVAQKLARAVSAPAGNTPQELLSDREYQVMKMIAGGRTVKEIAAELSLSVKTVSTYRTRILEKLGLDSNVEIARFALKAGLVG
jgi:two-component system invasion response regulator UvrY